MIGIMNRNRAVVSAALAGRDPKKQRAPPSGVPTKNGFAGVCQAAVAITPEDGAGNTQDQR